MQVYIAHGYNAYVKKHWFVWLKEELAKKGIQTHIFALPNATNPNVKEWLNTLKNEVKNPDEKTYFIGHSLGCITTLRFLQSLDEKTKIGGFILVSGFNQPLKDLTKLDAFIEPKLDYTKLINLSAKRLVIAARDDYIVPFSLSESLASNLKASFLLTDKGGHFMQDDGFTSFALLLNELEFMYAK